MYGAGQALLVAVEPHLDDALAGGDRVPLVRPDERGADFPKRDLLPLDLKPAARFRRMTHGF